MFSALNDLSKLEGTPIEANYLRLLDALNNHSGEEFADLFLENGVFTLIDGTELKGKNAIKESVEKLFEIYSDYSFFFKSYYLSRNYE